MYVITGLLLVLCAHAQITKLRYTQQIPAVRPAQPQQHSSASMPNFQRAANRLPTAVAERSYASSQVAAPPRVYAASAFATATSAAAGTAVNLYGEALQKCEYKGKVAREDCAWEGESPKICGFFLGFSVVPTASDLCTSVWDFEDTKYKPSLAKGFGAGAYRIMCNALPADVLDSPFTSEIMNKPVFSKDYGLYKPGEDYVEKTSISDQVSGRSGRFRQALEAICNTCIDQSPSAIATEALSSRCAILKGAPASAAAASALSTTKNIFGEQAQDCAPATLRSLPNYAAVRAANSYECAFTEQAPEICVNSGDGTRCIPFFDVESDGTRKSVLGFTGRLAAGIDIECGALPSDMLQSKFAKDMMSMVKNVKPKTSFTGAEYDKIQTVESRKAAKFRETIEYICSQCSQQASSEDARAALASKCESALGTTAPALVAQSKSQFFQNTSAGVPLVTIFLLALIVLRRFSIFRRSPNGLQEQLVRA